LTIKPTAGIVTTDDKGLSGIQPWNILAWPALDKMPGWLAGALEERLDRIKALALASPSSPAKPRAWWQKIGDSVSSGLTSGSISLAWSLYGRGKLRDIALGAIADGLIQQGLLPPSERPDV
jgi:hypothetical protein